MRKTDSRMQPKRFHIHKSFPLNCLLIGYVACDSLRTILTVISVKWMYKCAGF
jgi:hypothetical protein